MRASVFIDMARYTDAENSYLSILAIDPAHENASVGLSMLYLSKLPKPDKAEQLVSKLLEKYPQHARPWLLKAATAHEDERACRDALEKYLELVDRNNPYEKSDIERAQKRLTELQH
jgi:tetratricopeptide (TPR) repeat protein